MNCINLTAAQLRQAAEIKDQITALEAELGALVAAGGATASLPNGVAPPVKQSKFSPAAIARIRAAQKLRWAELKARLARHAD